MKSATEYLWFNTRNLRDYVNITREVEKVVKGSGIKGGLCLVNAMHIAVIEQPTVKKV